jgi:phosphatidylglycerol---prolipoprotein diacylglyceryl transferase
MLPIIFKFNVPFLPFPLELRSYGLMIAIGVITGYLVSKKYAKKIGLTEDNFLDLLMWLLLFCIIGAKLLYILTNDTLFYLHNPIEILKSGGVGLSFFGIIIAGILVALVYSKKKHINFWGLLDVLAIGVFIGYAFGRIGCFLNGCCCGIPTDSWLGFRFFTDDFMRLPTQLFTSFLALIGFFIVIKVEKTKRFYGKTAGIFLIVYAVITFIVEIWRDIPNRAIASILSWNQISAIIIIPTVIIFLVWLSNTQPILSKEGEIKSDIGTINDPDESNQEEQPTHLS